MTPQNDLDLKGNFQTHPFAELLTEIAAAKLAGSLRIERGDQKNIVYFDQGTVVYAVSNARKFRLSEILVSEKPAVKDFLAKTRNFPNDLEFANALKDKAVLTDDEIRTAFVQQIETILREILSWPDGNWTFSPLSRLKSGIHSKPNVPALLANYARSFSDNAISFRFKSMREMFALASQPPDNIILEPHEAFVLSRLSATPITISDIVALGGMPDQAVLKILYTLWLAGAATRKEWNPAFSEFRVAKIQGASLKLTRAAPKIEKPMPDVPTPPPIIETEPEPEIENITLDAYLERIEKAETHYEILGIGIDAKLAEIRATYFSLAKLFHPDRFHRGEAALLRRVENAFSKLAQAHEALRDPASRTAYDNKIRREAAEKKGRPETPLQVNVQGNQLHAERAGQEFDHGRTLLSDGDHEEALPFLARAVHLAPDVARYHAFYGKALSFAENGRHKAEGEMQAAIRLEPNNAAYRMMMAEFFLDVKLVKRAEGELNRILAIDPDHKEARSLLDSLLQK